jgi:hypothetical protein
MEFDDLAREEDDRIDWEESYKHGWIIRPKRVDPSQVKQDDPDEVPVFLGNGKYKFQGDVLTLTGNEALVVQAIVELRGASFDELNTKSGATNSSHVLSTIFLKAETSSKYKWLARFIVRPGIKGGGGYSTTIRALNDK